MNNDITKRIAMLYQERRFHSDDRVAAQKEDILTRHPVLRSIEERLTAENARIASQIIADGQMRGGTPEREELLQARTEYLRTNRISEDYDKAVPFCSNCGDTGYEGASRNRKCRCYYQLLVPLLFEYSNFHDLGKYTFDRFDSGLYSADPSPDESARGVSPREQIEAIRKVAEQFVRDVEGEDPLGMFLIGKPGTGKTFVAGCIANELIRMGKHVLYLSAPDLFEHIGEYRTANGAFSPDKERLEKVAAMYESIMNCDLLILDDLGTETYHANRQPELLAIINHRTGTGRKTIITTNLELTNLLQLYDERLLSRIYGHFTMIRFFGEDLRHVIRRQKKFNR
jgi:DNA replication protein DnaC